MYKKQKRSWAKHLDFIVLDLLASEIALFFCVFVKFHAILFLQRFEFYYLYQDLAWMLIFIDLASVLVTETYTGILRRTKYGEMAATFTHSLVNFGGVLIYMYVTQNSFFFSRFAIGLFGLSMVLFSYLFRVIWKRVVRARKLNDVNKSSMLVIADTSTVEPCLQSVAFNKLADYKVIGVCVMDKDMEGQNILDIPVVANSDTLFEFLRTNVVDEVFIDGDTREHEEKLADYLVEQGLTVHISLIHTGHVMPNRIMESYGNSIVLTTSMHIATNRQAACKRLTDIVGSLVGMVLMAIAFVIFAPIIKIQSPGPVFFTQTRIGRNGRPFKLFKFRTMYPDAEARKAELMAQNEVSGNMFKMENDPRIIPIGHFLRKSSIDELPQFINIFLGDMSLVGTRPPTADEYEKYALHHKARLSITPGLTGMWQVSGRSDIKDFEEVVALDTQYISNWSLGLDVKILFKTILVVFTGKGSR